MSIVELNWAKKLNIWLFKYKKLDYLAFCSVEFTSVCIGRFFSYCLLFKLLLKCNWKSFICLCIKKYEIWICKMYIVFSGHLKLNDTFLTNSFYWNARVDRFCFNSTSNNLGKTGFYYTKQMGFFENRLTVMKPFIHKNGIGICTVSKNWNLELKFHIRRCDNFMSPKSI